MTGTWKIVGLLLVLLSAEGMEAAAQKGPWNKSAEVVYVDRRGRERTEASASVIDHTAAGLSFKRSGREMTVSNDNVISVKYRREPGNWAGALALVNDGFLADALDALNAVLADDKAVRRSPWVQQEALFQIWTCYRLMGRPNEAATAAAALRTAKSNGRYIPELDLSAASDLLVVGKSADATKAYRKIQQQAKKGRIASSMGVRALSGLFELALQSNKTGDAKAVAEEIRASSSGASLVADVLSARVMVVQKNYKAAIAAFSELLGKAKRNQEAVIAGAANGMGDCFFAMGKFTDAQREYSKTASLFYEVASLQEKVGWAVWRWSVACKRVANSTDDEAARKTNTLRFKNLRRRAANDFPFTRGGRLAAQEMGR